MFCVWYGTSVTNFDLTHLFSQVSLAKRGNILVTKNYVKGVTFKRGFKNIFSLFNLTVDREFEMIDLNT